MVSASVVALLGTSYLVAVLSTTNGRTDHANTCCSRPLGAQPRPVVLTLAKEDASQKRVDEFAPHVPLSRAHPSAKTPTATHVYPYGRLDQDFPARTHAEQGAPHRAHTVSHGWLVIWGIRAPSKRNRAQSQWGGRQKSKQHASRQREASTTSKGGGGVGLGSKKNTTTAATAPHYEVGSCEDGGLRLLPVTHQRAKGTTHTRHVITAAGALGKPKQSVENAATTDQGDPPSSPAPPTATRTRAVSTADGEQQPAVGTTTDENKHGKRGTGLGP